MAVLTRGASRILVDSIAVDLQLKQVKFICCSFTIETKELECSWSLQVQPGMKWNGWCVDEMRACLKLKTNVVSSFIINQWRDMYTERAYNSASWTDLVEHLWLRSLILESRNCHASTINLLKALTSSNSASAFLPSTFTDCTTSHPPNPTTSSSSCCIISLHLGSRCCPRCLSWKGSIMCILICKEFEKCTLGDDCSCLAWECTTPLKKVVPSSASKVCQVVSRSAKHK